MQITCYSSFSKKPNSTKQPTGSGTVVTCVLKKPTSIIHPVFELQGSVTNYNYIKWGSHYYFVDDVILTHNNYTEYHCSIDVLASWKTEIGTSSEYVTRSASSYDGSIVDVKYPCKAGISQSSTHLTSFHSDFVENTQLGGFYVIGVMGATISASNAIQYYMMSASDMKVFLSQMFSNSWLDLSQTELTLDTQKQLINPSKYICSCRWYPMPYDASMGSVEDIVFGWWSIPGVQGLLLRERDMPYQEANITLPDHPDIARGSYLNAEPYTKRTLHMYNFGDINLPCGLFINQKKLTVDLSVDIWSGAGCLRLLAGNDLITQIIVDVGCEVPIGQIGNMISYISKVTSEYYGYSSNQWGDLSGLLPINDKVINKAVDKFLAGAFNAVSQLTAKPTVSGSQGTNAAYIWTPTVLSEFSRPVNEDLPQFGRPLYQVKTLNTLSGYILCSDPEVDIPGTQAEKEQIEDYLRTGFYYE